jgi:hypothetical protein
MVDFGKANPNIFNNFRPRKPRAEFEATAKPADSGVPQSGAADSAALAETQAAPDQATEQEALPPRETLVSDALEARGEKKPLFQAGQMVNVVGKRGGDFVTGRPVVILDVQTNGATFEYLLEGFGGPIPEENLELSSPTREQLQVALRSRYQKSQESKEPEPVQPTPAAAEPVGDMAEVERVDVGGYKVGDFVMLVDDNGDLELREPVLITRIDKEGDLRKYFLEGEPNPVSENHLELPTPERLMVAKARHEAKLRDSERYGAKDEQPVESHGATPDDVKAAVAEEVKKTLEEQLAELSSEKRAQFDAIVNNRNFLDKAGEFALQKLQGQKLWGVPLDFAVSFLGTSAARMAMRQSIKSVLSLSGWQMGAVIGGTFRGLREWRQGVKEQYSATSWAKELEGKDGLELAKAHQALTLAIKEAKKKKPLLWS